MSRERLALSCYRKEKQEILEEIANLKLRLPQNQRAYKNTNDAKNAKRRRYYRKNAKKINAKARARREQKKLEMH